ncbi:MAG: hypothetical protein ABSF82_00550 [Candidatus Bathyarchaeia archaeon]
MPKLSVSSTRPLARRLTFSQPYVQASQAKREGRWPQSFNRVVRIEDSTGLVWQSSRVIHDRVLLASSTIGKKANIEGHKGYEAKFTDRLTGEVCVEVFFDANAACLWCYDCELAALKRSQKSALTQPPFHTMHFGIGRRR